MGEGVDPDRAGGGGYEDRYKKRKESDDSSDDEPGATTTDPGFGSSDKEDDISETASEETQTESTEAKVGASARDTETASRTQASVGSELDSAARLDEFPVRFDRTDMTGTRVPGTDFNPSYVMARMMADGSDIKYGRSANVRTMAFEETDELLEDRMDTLRDAGYGQKLHKADLIEAALIAGLIEFDTTQRVLDAWGFDDVVSE